MMRFSLKFVFLTITLCAIGLTIARIARAKDLWQRCYCSVGPQYSWPAPVRFCGPVKPDRTKTWNQHVREENVRVFLSGKWLTMAQLTPRQILLINYAREAPNYG